MQDCLDGSLSVLIRCPGGNVGGNAPQNLGPEQITIDFYVTPWELNQNERVSGDTAVLVQAFCQEFAIPHLQRFTERCNVEGFKAPKLRCKISFILYFIMLIHYMVVRSSACQTH